MKVENNENKIIVYLYQYNLEIDNMEVLRQQIKNLFLRLIKKYQFNFFGYNIVHIYHNKCYGCILEIENLFLETLGVDIIDLKIIIHKDQVFYLEMDDWFWNKKNDLIIYNNKYYLNIEKLSNINKYIEFGKIKYNIELK